MSLQWNVNGHGDLVCEAAICRGEDGPMRLSLVSMGEGDWIAVVDQTTIAEGPLTDCIVACNRRVVAAKRDARIASLRREVNALERQEGGNWRKLRAVNDKRQRLDKLLARRELDSMTINGR